MTAVRRKEMRRRMVHKMHPNGDAVEVSDRRHKPPSSRYARGLTRASTCLARLSQDVDGRDEPGHDKGKKTGSRVCNAALRAAPRPGNEISYPGTTAAFATYSDASASLAPSPRSGGCARVSPRTAGRLLQACSRCSCRCESACGARVLRAGY